MDIFFEIIQSIEALGIILISLVSIYYGIRILIIHMSEHHKILKCCWVITLQTLCQIMFALIYFAVFWILISDRVFLRPQFTIGLIFLRPTILINNVIVSVYLKRRYIREGNKKKIGGLNG